jgi:hypothetical protein
LLTPPLRDLLVVAGEQNIRNGVALERARAGVLRIFEQAIREALLRKALLRADHARQLANTGIQKHHRSEFSTREHVIADGNFAQAAGVDDPLVEAFEPPRNQKDTGSLAQFGGKRVGQWFAAW